MKVWKYILLLILIQFGCNQKQRNKPIEIQTIEPITDDKELYNNIVKQEREDFKKLVLSNLVLESNREHIINYQNIEILKPTKRTKTTFYLRSKLPTGEVIEVNIQTKLFNKENRDIKYLEYGPVDSIDGQYAYYGDSIPTYPLYETELITVEINDRNLNLDKSSYSNLYDIHITEDKWVWDLGMNLVYDKSTNLIHLIFSGGSASGTYWAKLLFNKTEFLESYVLDYGVLSEHGSFYPQFKGF